MWKQPEGSSSEKRGPAYSLLVQGVWGQVSGLCLLERCQRGSVSVFVLPSQADCALPKPWGLSQSAHEATSVDIQESIE